MGGAYLGQVRHGLLRRGLVGLGEVEFGKAF